VKALTVFLPYVMPWAMGCPKPTARRALVDAAIEFCEQTKLLQDTLDPIDVLASQPAYDLYAPSAQMVVVQPEKVWFKDQELDPAASSRVSNVQAYRQDIPGQSVQKGDPREYFPIGSGQIGVYPIPDTEAPQALTVRASLKPKRSATQLDDVLYENWVEIIAAGALYRIHATPGQAYTDESQAMRRLSEFQAGVRKAAAEATRGRARGELRVAMTPLA
jgi:hypothetical protein